MFGRHIDYYLLRPFCSSKHLSLSEEEAAAKGRKIDINDGELADFLSCFSPRSGYRFDFKGKSVLEVGCGDGLLSLQMAKAGARQVLGVDIQEGKIKRANEALARYKDLGLPVRFQVGDITHEPTEEKYDIIVSLATFEHVKDLEHMLHKLGALLTPGGVIASVFGPLYHSPYGDHFDDCYKVKIPYRGILFNQRALMRIYRECYWRFDEAACIQDRVEGMNMITYDAFVEICKGTGLKILDLRPRVYNDNPQTRGIRGVIAGVLSAIPVVRNYIASSPVVLLVKEPVS